MRCTVVGNVSCCVRTDGSTRLPGLGPVLAHLLLRCVGFFLDVHYSYSEAARGSGPICLLGCRIISKGYKERSVLQKKLCTPVFVIEEVRKMHPVIPVGGNTLMKEIMRSLQKCSKILQQAVRTILLEYTGHPLRFHQYNIQQPINI